MADRHFIEINVMHKRTPTTLRFFGRGEWMVKDGENWQPINAIYIPREALRIAADQCQPIPAE